MRVIFVTFGMNLWSGGGSNYSLHLTLSELHRRGVDVELLVLTAGGLQAPDVLPYPVRNLKWKIGGQLGTMLRVRRLLERYEHESDLYHLYGPQLMFAGGMYRSSGGRVPVAVTLNDYQPVCSNVNCMDGHCQRTCTILQKTVHSDRPLTRKLLRIPLEIYWASQGRKYARSVDRLLPDSESLRTVYAEGGFDMSCSTVIPEMIDYEQLRASGEPRRGGASEGRVWQIAYVGRLIRAKGVDLLLDAVAALRPHARLHLHIAGDGPERAALERQAAQLGLTGHVTFHGWTLHDQVWSIYQAADLFVHPGRWPEPFGRTIIEALTLGLPTIVSDVGHPPVLVRGVGLTFRSGDRADLAGAIATATGDYDRLAAATRAASGRIARFGADVVVSSLLDVYQRLVQRPHSQPASRLARSPAPSPRLHRGRGRAGG
jgi:glycosyltransferase involved in cell wall biosynthesis